MNGLGVRQAFITTQIQNSVKLETCHVFGMGLRGGRGERLKSPYASSLTRPMNF